MNPARICLLYPQYGHFPSYFELWALSASKNTAIDFYLITDLGKPLWASKYPNLRFVSMKLEEIKNRAQSILKFQCTLNQPYKLCDYRPLYPLIFADLIKPYEYWGYGDLDTILGSFSSFLTPEVLASNDLFFGRGHLSIFRNENSLNSLPLSLPESTLREVYQSERFSSFDESQDGLPALCRKKGMKYFSDFSLVAEMRPEVSRLSNAGRPNEKNRQVYFWKDGVLTCFFLNHKDVHLQKYIYIHLQKRNMKNRCHHPENGFLIAATWFQDQPRQPSSKDVKKGSRRNLAFFLHFKYLYFKYYFLSKIQRH
jgi:hypothetical protein